MNFLVRPSQCLSAQVRSSTGIARLLKRQWITGELELGGAMLVFDSIELIDGKKQCSSPE